MPRSQPGFPISGCCHPHASDELQWASASQIPISLNAVSPVHAAASIKGREGRSAGRDLSMTVSSKSDRALPTLHQLDQLVELVLATPQLFVRWSRGPDFDLDETS